MERSKREPDADLLSARNIFIVLIILALLILLVWLIVRFNQLSRQVERLEPEYFVRDQVVLLGTSAGFEAAVTAVEAELGIDLELIDFPEESGIVPDPPSFLQPPSLEQTESIGYKNNFIGPHVASRINLDANRTQGLDGQVCGRLDYQVRLYRIVERPESADVTVNGPEPVTVDRVIEVIRDTPAANSALVFADPNYIIGHSPLIVEGDPDTSEGSALLAASEGAAREEFLKQWALYDRGIFLLELDSGGTPRRTVTPMGASVIVAMFDTSPFDLQQLPVAYANTNVQHFEVAGIPDARDHGVYGASLVNAIAPASEIRIYRVLNERNQGDLATLLRALNALCKDWRETSGRPLVVNLSLGVHSTPDNGNDDSEQTDSRDVLTLKEVLNGLSEMGAVIVAASGNDSAELSRNGQAPARMQIPADYDFVIGVGASNFRGGPSCFSNDADVYAPGGDNGPGCLPVVDKCPTDPSACLIGYSVYTSPKTRYAYWLGTSFAAPLVSGQAALLLEEGMSPKDVQQHIINTGTQISGSNVPLSTGDRIINIRASLENLP